LVFSRRIFKDISKKNLEAILFIFAQKNFLDKKKSNKKFSGSDINKKISNKSKKWNGQVGASTLAPFYYSLFWDTTSSVISSLKTMKSKANLLSSSFLSFSVSQFCYFKWFSLKCSELGLKSIKMRLNDV